MKVFVDIGGYNGDTLLEADKYDYDIIHVFEPCSKHHEILEKLKGYTSAVTFLYKFGLGYKYGKVDIFSAGSDGASIYKSKPQPAQTNIIEKIEIFPASDWFYSSIAHHDQVHVKINVEGAELRILNSLLNNRELYKIDELLIYYDAAKIPELKRFVSDMERRLDDSGYAKTRLSLVRNEVWHGPKCLNKPYFESWLEYINKSN